MDGLSGSLSKASQKRFCLPPEIKLAKHKAAQIHQFETQGVVPRFRILPDIAEISEGGKEAMDCPLGKVYF